MYCDYKINMVCLDLNTQVNARFYEGDYEEQENPLTKEKEQVYVRSKIIDDVTFWFEGKVSEETINEKLKEHLDLIRGKRIVIPELT